VSHKNDTDVGRFSFDGYQPMLIIFGSIVPERERYQTVVYFPYHVTNVSALPGETQKRENLTF